MADEQELPAYPIRAYQLIPDPNQPTVVALAIETEQGHSLFLATRQILEDLGKDLLERAAKDAAQTRSKLAAVAGSSRQCPRFGRSMRRSTNSGGPSVSR
jgi:hypothetical protein